MLRKVVVALVVLVAGLVALVATRPGEYRVVRSVVVEESPRPLFNLVSDFNRWPAWSPWARLDPAMKTTIEGEPSRPGSSYAWSGNDKVGEGRMTITEVHGPRLVKMRLDFLKPWKSTSLTTFNLVPEARGTRVVWIMDGQLDLLGKAMCLFMDMDQVIGADLERGLATIKQGVEGETIPR